LQTKIELIKSEVYNNGPVITSIQTIKTNFDFILGPIIIPNTVWKPVTQIIPATAAWQASHAIMIIGWGPDYWIVQNCWGENWGYSGVYYNAFGTAKIEDNVLTGYIEGQIDYAKISYGS
jgi:hypothetical protein